MPIDKWPENERPREKLIKLGAGALSDAELLAVVLRTGITGKDAVAYARDLLTRFGGLRNLVESTYSEITSYHGMGLSRYTLLQAILELGNRCLMEDIKRGEQLDSTDGLKKYVVSKMRHLDQEIFSCIYLDTLRQVLSYQELFFGSIATSHVYPREVVKSALAHHAVEVVLVHNHPSGKAVASEQDIATTDRLKAALNTVDIRVLDHIIVADNKTFSFYEHDLL